MKSPQVTMVQRFSLRRQLSKVGSWGPGVRVEGSSRRLRRGVLVLQRGSSVKPASSEPEEGLGQEALPFVLSSDRHKG